MYVTEENSTLSLNFRRLATVSFYGSVIAHLLRMNRFKPHLALFLSNSIWAINYPFYHMVMRSGITPSAMLFASLLVAAALSFVPLLWSRGEKVDRKDIKYLIAAAILSGLMRKGFVIFGLSHTSPIDASIIASLLPVMALIISVVIGIDRFTPKRIFGIALGMGGVLAVILSGNHASKTAGDLTGNTLMFLYTIAAGFYMVWLQPIFKKYKPVTLLRWIYSLSSLMFLPFGLEPLLHTQFSSMSPHILTITIFVIAIPTFLPNILLNYALGRVTPTISSIYSYLQPILAIIVSVWLGLDKLHWSTLVYGTIIISGVTMVIQSYTQPKKAIS
ncbi:MAG: DMT family transporter [Rikenellaceae bacterium]